MLFAEFFTEGTLAVGGVGSLFVGAITVVFKLLMTAKNEQIISITSERDSWKQMYSEAIGNLELAVNAKRAKEGKEHFKPVAAVVAEHNSPTTKEQQMVADMATERARLVAATMALELPARKEGEPALPLTLESLKAEIDKVPDRTAEKVVEKLDEKKSSA